MMKVKIQSLFFILLIILTFGSKPVLGQSLKTDNDSIDRKRLNTVIYTSAGLYTATLTVLYFGWYKGTPMSSFHFINDNENFLQADKMGHAVTAYTFSGYANNWLRWAGLSNNKAAIYGSLMGFGSMTVIEILDGFSAEYGASWGDLVANGTGSLLFASQQLIWKEQRFRLKFSYHPTSLADYNPELLGENGLQKALKDYNGQTFWLSANINSFLKRESKFPPWINVAVGYGGRGLIGVKSNPTEIDGVPIPHFDRVRHYYASMDIDWTKIKTNSKFLKFTFKTLSFIKLPFPTLEYNKKDEFVFHWLYF
ncbi:MAG: DUF2279 domain-containing protein [Marinilabiliales bacterium]|nr:MAG: DUF2279 domain-containing protein [Marinilabiliales bacterium]